MRKERKKEYGEPMMEIIGFQLEEVVLCSALDVVDPIPGSGTGGEIDHGDFEWSNWF